MRIENGNLRSYALRLLRFEISEFEYLLVIVSPSICTCWDLGLNTGFNGEFHHFKLGKNLVLGYLLDKPETYSTLPTHSTIAICMYVLRVL